MTHPPAATAEGRRILLVEPTQPLRHTLSDLVGCHGRTSHAAGDRRSALRAVAGWRPTVMVLDPCGWHGQGKARDELLDVLHAVADVRAADPRLPSVLYTAMFAPGVWPELGQFGVVRSVAKGDPPGELPAAVWDAHAVGRWRGWNVAAGVAR